MYTSNIQAEFELEFPFDRRVMEAVGREIGLRGLRLIRQRVDDGDIAHPTYSTKPLYVSNKDRFRGERRAKWAAIRSRIPDQFATGSGRGWYFPYGYEQFKSEVAPEFDGRVDLTLTGEMWNDLSYKVSIVENLASVEWKTDGLGRSTRIDGQLPFGWIDVVYGLTTIESADIAEGITHGNRYNPHPRPFLFFSESENEELRGFAAGLLDSLLREGYTSRTAGGQFRQLPRNLFTIRD